MPFAVHNVWVPSVEIDARGTYSHDGVNRIPAGVPLHVEESRDAAEAWRAGEQKKWERARD